MFYDATNIPYSFGTFNIPFVIFCISTSFIICFGTSFKVVILDSVVGALGCPMITTSVKDDDQVVEYTTDPELIHERYGREVALVIDGGIGDNVPTTVVDLTGDGPEILREGKGELQ